MNLDLLLSKIGISQNFVQDFIRQKTEKQAQEEVMLAQHLDEAIQWLNKSSTGQQLLKQLADMDYAIELSPPEAPNVLTLVNPVLYPKKVFLGSVAVGQFTRAVAWAPQAPPFPLTRDHIGPNGHFQPAADLASCVTSWLITQGR